MKHPIYTLFFLIALLACGDEIPQKEDPFEGSWKIVEAYTEDGGSDVFEWEKVVSDKILSFEAQKLYC